MATEAGISTTELDEAFAILEAFWTRVIDADGPDR